MCSVCGDPNHNMASVQARLYDEYKGPGSGPDYRWKIQVPVGRGRWIDVRYIDFQLKEDAWAWIDHHNKDSRWIRDNINPKHSDEITEYRLVEIPAPRVLTPDEIFANIAEALDEIENGPDFE